MRPFFPGRKLTVNELLLIPETLFNLAIARLKVSIFPSAKYLPPVPKSAKHLPPKEKVETSKIIASVISGLSSRTPFASTCLVKVLAMHKMLERRKIPHTVHFGITKNQSRELNAHAWLSVAGEVLIGGENLQDFQEISRFLF